MNFRLFGLGNAILAVNLKSSVTFFEPSTQPASLSTGLGIMLRSALDLRRGGLGGELHWSVPEAQSDCIGFGDQTLKGGHF